MVRFYIAFDDTDSLDCGRGTGKLARWFCEQLPAGYNTWGVVRQQLLNAPEIPKTSHNSALCCVVDAPSENHRQALIEMGIRHIGSHFVEGSDPGFCVASQSDPALKELQAFGIRCTATVVTREEAKTAAGGCHLSDHGGSGDGIIGAAAAVGLTSLGESGRLVAYRDIRELPQIISAGDLRAREIFPLSAQRHAEYIPDHHRVDTCMSLRPHLSAGRLMVPLLSTGQQEWQVIDNRER